MPLQGSLREMSLADLIQVNCQEMRSACLTLQYEDQEGEVYFSDGQVVHASLGQQAGEPAIYEMLAWENGTFQLERDQPTPAKTIALKWNELLLEGMKWAVLHPPTRSKTERTMKPDTLAQLKSIDGVSGVVICSSDGIVLSSDISGSDGEGEAAVAVFVGGAAGQLGEALKQSAFSHGLVTLKHKRLLVLAQPDRYVGLVLTEHGSPAIVGHAAAELLKK